jgi:hypothetical protein
MNKHLLIFQFDFLFASCFNDTVSTENVAWFQKEIEGDANEAVGRNRMWSAWAYCPRICLGGGGGGGLKP